MAKTTNSKKTQVQTENLAKTDSTVEVLYQKMGDRWFAFSLVDDEIFIGSIGQDEIDAADSRHRGGPGKTAV
jgi:hypothetical protein